MKHGNCSWWIEWKSCLHANPSQLTHDVPVTWFIGILLLFHDLLIYNEQRCMLVVSFALCTIQWSDTRRAPPHLRVQLKSVRYEYSIAADRTGTSVFLRWNTFYFSVHIRHCLVVPILCWVFWSSCDLPLITCSKCTQSGLFLFIFCNRSFDRLLNHGIHNRNRD